MHVSIKLVSLRAFTNLFTHIIKRNKTKMASRKFKFTDYDCIGFDLDNTLARYKIGNMVELEYDIISKYLVNKKGYDKKHLSRPIDYNFILRGLIVDNDNGNLLRVSSDGTILQASHGTKWLNNDEILKYYPNRHWELTDLFVADPLQTWNGPSAEKMRTLLDYYDTVVSLVFARAVDTIDETVKDENVQYTIWPDILECMIYMFDRSHFNKDYGEYFPELKCNPDKYYYKCSNTLIDWLKALKQSGKRLFLVTGSHVDFASHTASNTVGENWKDYFDIVITYAKKPGFFTQNRNFLSLKGHEENGPISYDELKVGGIYSQGNWEDLKKFMMAHSKSSNPKILYVGDNLVQDVYTPKVHSNCDTVAVCEELGVEMKDKFNCRWHPDETLLRSTIWGSYFRCKNSNNPTNWYHLMKRYSRLWVPSLEYTATFPIDHAFITEL